MENYRTCSEGRRFYLWLADRTRTIEINVQQCYNWATQERSRLTLDTWRGSLLGLALDGRLTLKYFRVTLEAWRLLL
jgi:hypothetical protein